MEQYLASNLWQLAVGCFVQLIANSEMLGEDVEYSDSLPVFQGMGFIFASCSYCAMSSSDTALSTLLQAVFASGLGYAINGFDMENLVHTVVIILSGATYSAARPFLEVQSASQLMLVSLAAMGASYMAGKWNRVNSVRKSNRLSAVDKLKDAVGIQNTNITNLTQPTMNAQMSQVLMRNPTGGVCYDECGRLAYNECNDIQNRVGPMYLPNLQHPLVQSCYPVPCIGPCNSCGGNGNGCQQCARDLQGPQRTGLTIAQGANPFDPQCNVDINSPDYGMGGDKAQLNQAKGINDQPGQSDQTGRPRNPNAPLLFQEKRRKECPEQPCINTKMQGIELEKQRKEDRLVCLTGKQRAEELRNTYGSNTSPPMGNMPGGVAQNQGGVAQNQGGNFGGNPAGNAVGMTGYNTATQAQGYQSQSMPMQVQQNNQGQEYAKGEWKWVDNQWQWQPEEADNGNRGGRPPRGQEDTPCLNAQEYARWQAKQDRDANMNNTVGLPFDYVWDRDCNTVRVTGRKRPTPPPREPECVDCTQYAKDDTKMNVATKMTITRNIPLNPDGSPVPPPPPQCQCPVPPPCPCPYPQVPALTTNPANQPCPCEQPCPRDQSPGFGRFMPNLFVACPQMQGCPCEPQPLPCRSPQRQLLPPPPPPLPPPPPPVKQDECKNLMNKVWCEMKPDGNKTEGWLDPMDSSVEIKYSQTKPFGLGPEKWQYQDNSVKDDINAWSIYGNTLCMDKLADSIQEMQGPRNSAMMDPNNLGRPPAGLFSDGELKQDQAMFMPSYGLQLDGGMMEPCPEIVSPCGDCGMNAQGCCCPSGCKKACVNGKEVCVPDNMMRYMRDAAFFCYVWLFCIAGSQLLKFMCN